MALLQNNALAVAIRVVFVEIIKTIILCNIHITITITFPFQVAQKKFNWYEI